MLYFLVYISQTQDISLTRLDKMLEESKIAGGEMMQTLAQRLEEKGERNKAVETAKRMLNKGFDPDMITELTGLGKEEIKKLSSPSTFH